MWPIFIDWYLIASRGLLWIIWDVNTRIHWWSTTQHYSSYVTWCLPFFFVEGHRRVAKVAFAHTILAMERLTELIAHGTQFGDTTPLLIGFLTFEHATIFAWPTGRHGGGHRCHHGLPWSLERSAHVKSIRFGCGSVHWSLRCNWQDDDGDRQQQLRLNGKRD